MTDFKINVGFNEDRKVTIEYSHDFEIVGDKERFERIYQETLDAFIGSPMSREIRNVIKSRLSALFNNYVHDGNIVFKEKEENENAKNIIKNIVMDRESKWDMHGLL